MNKQRRKMYGRLFPRKFLSEDEGFGSLGIRTSLWELPSTYLVFWWSVPDPARKQKGPLQRRLS